VVHWNGVTKSSRFRDIALKLIGVTSLTN